VIAGQIYFDSVLQNYGVYPHEDFSVRVQEDHVFVYDEVAVTEGEPFAGGDEAACVGGAVWGEGRLFE
jgi:hypothetical protein